MNDRDTAFAENEVVVTNSGSIILAHELADRPLDALVEQAGAMRDAGHGNLISYSRKLFLPVTHLCRDVCRYCTFAGTPRAGANIYMSRDGVLAAARKGVEMGCREALFTLGDAPERRWPAARDALTGLGHRSTLGYLAELSRLVFDETGLFPHANPGLMSRWHMERLRTVSASMGLMLETVSDRLGERGGPHYGCPDKQPVKRLDVLNLAGKMRVPFTTGLLVGIGETRIERIETLLAIKQLHDRYGHIQEVIIQPFRPKTGTPMSRAPAASSEELLWTIAAARVLLGAKANIQSPPNLSPGDLPGIIAAGANDLGGISPLTPDFVNPEAPWPHIDALAERVAACGKLLVERLAVYPNFAMDADTWLAPDIGAKVRRDVDAGGWPRSDNWIAGQSFDTPPSPALSAPFVLSAHGIGGLLRQAGSGARLSEASVAELLSARGEDISRICAYADVIRREMVGDAVSFVVTRNINYTNRCSFGCRFCAFSKGRRKGEGRDPAYRLTLEEVEQRTAEAWRRGATEVCLQGGIHPEYDGETYLAILAAAKKGCPDIHVHAFSPLEIRHGAETLGLAVEDYLQRLKTAGLGSLPGTAAEILDDEVRAQICPDKLDTAAWLDTIRSAHRIGLRTTATIMFGHVDRYSHAARHILHIRDLQSETGGFTEFVPLPFVAAEAPLFRSGRSRQGPTFREALLMHAVARLALHPLVPNIQASWVKMGAAGAARCLTAGVNDLGGTLMDESITRAAGARHGQEMTPAALERLILAAGRSPRIRTTLYGDAPASRCQTAHAAANLHPLRELNPTLAPPPRDDARVGEMQLDHHP